MSVALPTQQLAEPEPTGVEIRDLTIEAGNTPLLENVSVQIPAGKITLIVGCSGVGKSLLLRAMAGLIDGETGQVRWRGSIRSGGMQLGNRAAAGQVGVVFQHFALFDELSPRENVRIAQDHGHRRPVEQPPSQWLDELQVPSRRPTSVLSGGQRQRLAIARALAYDAPILLYDEPTSGLDPVTARRVAKLIRDTNDAHGKTTIIVTHDFHGLLPIADEVLLLDPADRALHSIPRAEWPEIHRRLHPSVEEDAPGTSEVSVLGRVGGAVSGFLVATSRVVEELVCLPARLLPWWRSPYWAGRFLLHYLRLVGGPTACAYLLIAGAIVGFVTTYFTFRFLPYPNYTKPLLIEDLLQSMGFALYRVFVPLLATLLIAARCGAAVASDVGAKSYGSQLDAMRSLAINPRRYLLTTVLYSFLLAVPALTALGYLAAALISMVVFTATHPGLGPEFWSLHFHRRLIIPGHELYDGTWWLLAKLLLCAAGTALIAFHLGARPKPTSSSVSHSITATILWATLWVLAVHFAFAFLEF
jgi:ABC-type transporter Mla maintaining outer membrane lipid asymmetry ATPase subunit MlaF/ABC-type transporter Mla maintaining outer membrane lipid asymmetry permease subunit MlaE